MKSRKAVAPVIATLLLVAIAVVGGSIIFVFSQGFFSSVQIDPTIQENKYADLVAFSTPLDQWIQTKGDKYVQISNWVDPLYCEIEDNGGYGCVIDIQYKPYEDLGWSMSHAEYLEEMGITNTTQTGNIQLTQIGEPSVTYGGSHPCAKIIDGDSYKICKQNKEIIDNQEKIIALLVIQSQAENDFLSGYASDIKYTYSTIDKYLDMVYFCEEKNGSFTFGSLPDGWVMCTYD